ncbi:hypothetical protein G7Y89_g6398 [Cudoniella acicularis]|uniref:LITAF domain-containing protein n=1 Tax=Cudoniella acicularis TaxID=354080 RepID=A0A8H4W2G9_9HELO|nr:hypothetical protein G7Y89_g6398 [Cudoniella acicularis]
MDLQGGPPAPNKYDPNQITPVSSSSQPYSQQTTASPTPLIPRKPSAAGQTVPQNIFLPDIHQQQNLYSQPQHNSFNGIAQQQQQQQIQMRNQQNHRFSVPMQDNGGQRGNILPIPHSLLGRWPATVDCPACGHRALTSRNFEVGKGTQYNFLLRFYLDAKAFNSKGNYQKLAAEASVFAQVVPTLNYFNMPTKPSTSDLPRSPIHHPQDISTLGTVSASSPSLYPGTLTQKEKEGPNVNYNSNTLGITRLASSYSMIPPDDSFENQSTFIKQNGHTYVNIALDDQLRPETIEDIANAARKEPTTISAPNLTIPTPSLPLLASNR